MRAGGNRCWTTLAAALLLVAVGSADALRTSVVEADLAALVERCEYASMSNVFHYNSISSNAECGFYDADATVRDAEDNWWGAAGIPGDLSGSDEADPGPPFECYDPTAASDTNGTVDSVSDLNIDHGPWRLKGHSANSLVLEADDCQDDKDTGLAGHQIEVELSMYNVVTPVTGFTAFMQFDDTKLIFVGGTYTSAPFPNYIPDTVGTLAAPDGDIVEAGGYIQLGDPGWPGVTGDALLATLTFTVVDECETTDLILTSFGPFYSELSYQGVPVSTNLVNSPVISLDDTAPTITNCPDDIEVNADAGGCDASVTFGGATAADDCGMHPTEPITYWIGATPIASPHTFPDGTTTVTVEAKDACDNVNGTCIFDVTVLAYNTFVVDVQVEGALYDPNPGVAGDTITRCILFEFDCSGSAPVWYTEEFVTFSVDDDGTNGYSITPPDQLITDLPCGSYTCVTAEDELHSLRVMLTPTISGDEWVASFTVDDKLTQGDLYNDELVDIVDFGVYISEWGATYGGDPNTSCTTPWPHADISGDAAIGPADFAFVQTNFLSVGDGTCCGSGPSREPRTSISLRELEQLGLGQLARADLNHDGVLDLADVEAYLDGEVPEVWQEEDLNFEEELLGDPIEPRSSTGG